MSTFGQGLVEAAGQALAITQGLAALPSPEAREAHCELDLTTFQCAEDFEDILREFGAGLVAKLGKVFVWGGPDLVIETACNPLTGESGWDPDDRRYLGYASDITVAGKAMAVIRFSWRVRCEAEAVTSGHIQPGPGSLVCDAYLPRVPA